MGERVSEKKMCTTSRRREGEGERDAKWMIKERRRGTE
tara:strand:- start:250 stop:363 length:114 start_codon:yes stop_codon:yes gene_type:complete